MVSNFIYSANSCHKSTDKRLVSADVFWKKCLGWRFNDLKFLIWAWRLPIL